ncbi:histidine phosphatase family protein [Plantactinospora sp. GCM10030261]|uniref:histidine phosphatase family protein n=1 Tax=Plantactinospora sp. GCM10030261 TaxID=3273420 RepID=UPI003619DE1F
MAELDHLWVVRHGESVGNVAAAHAEDSGVERIDLTERDADVPLSPLGREQAEATGRWLAGLSPADRPEAAVVSPYRRTAETAELALRGSGIPASHDERLRDRELGILDLLTSHGTRVRYPEEVTRRRHLGKFYYRPPGGESWADVTLRLRSLLGDLRRDHAGRRVILFGHEAVVLLLRYLVEGLSEPDLMDVARSTTVANCSVTGWADDGRGALRLISFNDVTHLERQSTPPTREDEVDAEPV